MSFESQSDILSLFSEPQIETSFSEDSFSFGYGRNIPAPIPSIVNCAFQNNSKNQPPSWYEPYFPRQKSPPVRKTLYRNNKVFNSQFLPTVSVSNLRSLWPKINNFKNDFLEREVSLGLLSEIWQKKGNKKHKYEIEKML